MALNLPKTSKEVSDRAKVDVRRSLDSSDPFLSRSYLGAITVGLSNRNFEFFLALVDSENEVTPLRAVRQLQSWATSYGFFNLAGGTARGDIWINASGSGLGVLVPNLTKYIASDGGEFEQQADVTLAASNISITGITRSGSTATATTATDHNLGSNALVSISGANEAGYNLALTAIVVTDTNKFEYEVDSGTATPATGTISVDVFGGFVEIRADLAGIAGNLGIGAELSFESAISTVETKVQAGNPGIGGGTADETDEAMRGRLISQLQNPVANFNDSQIDSVAKTVSGVTRTFVQKSTPANGQVSIQFMRDNDADTPIPNAAQIADVVSALSNIQSATMAVADMIVTAPTAVPAPFTFTALNPDTATMRSAITQQLKDYFALVPDIATDVTEDAYKANIFNTFDAIANARLISFTISQSGAVSVSAGQIATLGTIIFP